MFDSIRLVDPQDGDRRPSNGSQADQNRTLPMEMFGPFILPWIEQRRETLGIGFITRNVWSLEGIARQATPGQVFEIAGTGMFLGTNMVPLEGANVTVFRHLTVFAPTPRSISYKLSARFGHELLAILGRRLERQACFGLD